MDFKTCHQGKYEILYKKETQEITSYTKYQR